MRELRFTHDRREHFPTLMLSKSFLMFHATLMHFVVRKQFASPVPVEKELLHYARAIEHFSVLVPCGIMFVCLYHVKVLCQKRE